MTRKCSCGNQYADTPCSLFRESLQANTRILQWEEEITTTVAKGGKPDYTDTPLSAAEIAGPGWKARQLEPERFVRQMGNVAGLELKVRDLMSPGYIGRPNRNTWLMATSMAGV
jgi:hypothetical protein